jgi:hypothetical protein
MGTVNPHMEPYWIANWNSHRSMYIRKHVQIVALVWQIVSMFEVCQLEGSNPSSLLH